MPAVPDPDALTVTGTPTGGTFTCHWGRGTSDRLPYDATIEQIDAAWKQARARDEEIRRAASA